MNLGKAIKVCRQAKKLTQSQLAKKAKISISYLSLLERGMRDPNISILKSISKALNIPFAVLIFVAADKNDLPELGEKLSNKLIKLAFEAIACDK